MQLRFGLATASFCCEQNINSCLKPIVCPRNVFEFVRFAGFLCCSAVRGSCSRLGRLLSLHLLLPAASTNCFPWKSKGNGSNEFSYLQPRGFWPSLWLLHLQRFIGEECRATNTRAFIYSCTKTPKLNFSPWDPAKGLEGMVQTLLRVLQLALGRISLLRGWINPGSVFSKSGGYPWSVGV